MKIGIVTIIDYNNYGNRLQNYAIDHLLKEMGVAADTLQITILTTSDVQGFSWLRRMLHYILPNFMWDIKNSLLTMTALERQRQKRFIKFSKKNIKTRRLKFLLGRKPIETLGECYDMFVTGSDQVWNPIFAGESYFFLTFAPPNKRMAFSASIGTDKLPENKEDYSQWFREMRFISVREKSAADLIESLIGVRPEVWLDPTLLIDRIIWQKLMRRPTAEIPERYILSAFLGKEPDEILAGYEREIKLPIIQLNNKVYPQYYIIDPSEFLYLIEHANLVLTDSFHAMIFAINFHVPFFIFQRGNENEENLFTRIECVLERFGLENRYRERNWHKEYSTWEDITEAQFAEIENQISIERQRVEKTIRNILSL